MTNSKQIAGLIGPTLIALGVTETVNLHISATNITPVIYLNGTILFVVGLAIVRARNQRRPTSRPGRRLKVRRPPQLPLVRRQRS
jgi:hypothetical protein